MHDEIAHLKQIMVESAIELEKARVLVTNAFRADYAENIVSMSVSARLNRVINRLRVATEGGQPKSDNPWLKPGACS